MIWLTIIALCFAFNALLFAWLAFGRFVKGPISQDEALFLHKAGLNNLDRWKQFGGTLDRPPPPEPMNPARGPQAAPEHERAGHS